MVNKDLSGAQHGGRIHAFESTFPSDSGLYHGIFQIFILDKFDVTVLVDCGHCLEHGQCKKAMFSHHLMTRGVWHINHGF